MQVLLALGLLTVGGVVVHFFGNQFQGEVWKVMVGMGLFALMGLALGTIADNLLTWLTNLVKEAK